MEKDYSNFTATDFLKDDYFLQWQFLRKTEDEKYWTEFVRNNPDRQSEISRAVSIFNSLKLNNYELDSNEKESLLASIKEKINTQKKKRKQILIYSLSAAASIALIIAFSLHYISSLNSPEKTITATRQHTEPSNKEIRLFIADKEALTVAKNAEIQYNSNGDITITTETQQVTTVETDKKETKSNKLIVPKGKRSFLVLKDGTKIWVNSGTTIEFPNTFECNKREIKVEGEIYLEVEKDENRPFYVTTNDFNVRVLGTRFNLSAYNDDKIGNIVLVEGSVDAGNATARTLLQPNYLLNINEGKHTLSKVNVYDYICWKDGLLQFRSKPLKEILNTLSRYYDVEFDCANNTENMKCTGKLVLFDNLDDVLNTISNTIPVRCTKSETKISVVKK